MEEQNEKKLIEKERSNKGLWIGFVVIALFMGAFSMYLVMRFLPLKSVTVNKSEKEVTITDAGISEAVDKLYDAVVVVETFKNGTQISSGSGFVYQKTDNTGYILTNNHVIDNGDEIKVIFTNGEEVAVKVLGSEIYSDIAVLAVDADKVISVAEIGNNDEMKLGDTVFTIGAPIGTNYSGTVTRGILSGKDRMISVYLSNNSNSTYMMKVIQTDAAINSGNSGGPLADYNGKVIGINSLKLISTGVEGIGFAIPIEDALESAEMLVSNGKIKRPYLGILMSETNDVYLLARYNISLPKNAEGAVVVSVEEGTPAKKYGMESGDVIIKIGDKKVTSIAEFKYALYQYNPGDKIDVQVVRGSETKTLSVTLGSSSE